MTVRRAAPSSALARNEAGLAGEGSRPTGLLRVLGVGFGLAVVVGGMIGTGILRTPGPVAAILNGPV